jgi:NAD(P)-dependent dehydrogenase (short-subunit alcohol dehydrogenase family)
MIRSAHSLHQRVALIVGGARGLGLAIAEAYVREGARVVIADRDASAAQGAVSALGAEAEAAAVDIADPADSARLVAGVVARRGQLDILVNCAAICLVDPLLDVTPERWDQVFAVNAKGAFFLMQHAARAMTARRHGRIINVSTPASRLGIAVVAAMGASSRAVACRTRAAALAWAPHGITVNAIVPGRMTGGMIDALERDLERVTGKPAADLAADRTKALPMGRRVEPSEVAQAAVWLASDAASYVTAERFNFTGGMEVA